MSDVAEEISQDDTNLSPLHVAAGLGDVDEMRRLLDADPELLMKRSKQENTPLHSAAAKGQLAAVEFLLEAGAEVDATNTNKRTPLFGAVGCGSCEVVRALIEAGANVYACDGEDTTLILDACSGNSLDVLMMLVDAGADPLAREPEGQMSSLHAAVIGGCQKEAAGVDTGVFKYLIDIGADVNAVADVDDSTVSVLELAVMMNSVEAVELLLDGNANIDQPNPDGFTPLMVAMVSDYTDVAAVLIKRGAAFETADLCEFTSMGFVTMLIDAGVNINLDGITEGQGVDNAAPGDAAEDEVPDALRSLAANGAMASALKMAVADGHLPSVRFLIDAGADLETPLNSDHATALFTAARRGHAEVVQVLLDAGANIEASIQTDSWTSGARPLHGAALNGETETVEVLLEYGAEVDSQTDDGRTPLAVAAGKGASVKLLSALVEAGADPNPTGGKLTPLGGAVLGEHVDAVRYLLSVGADAHARVGVGGRHIVELAADQDSAEIEAMIREAIA